MRERLRVIHDGIRTDLLTPDPSAWVSLNRAGLVLRQGDEVVTFIKTPERFTTIGAKIAEDSGIRVAPVQAGTIADEHEVQGLLTPVEGRVANVIIQRQTQTGIRYLTLHWPVGVMRNALSSAKDSDNILRAGYLVHDGEAPPQEWVARHLLMR